MCFFLPACIAQEYARQIHSCVLRHILQAQAHATHTVDLSFTLTCPCRVRRLEVWASSPPAAQLLQQVPIPPPHQHEGPGPLGSKALRQSKPLVPIYSTDTTPAVSLTWEALCLHPYTRHDVLQGVQAAIRAARLSAIEQVHGVWLEPKVR